MFDHDGEESTAPVCFDVRRAGGREQFQLCCSSGGPLRNLGRLALTV